NEEHLVVMPRLRKRLLKVEQLVHLKVATVGKGHAAGLTGGAELLLESACGDASMPRCGRHLRVFGRVFQRKSRHEQRSRAESQRSDRVSALCRLRSSFGARMAHDHLAAARARR